MVKSILKLYAKEPLGGAGVVVVVLVVEVVVVPEGKNEAYFSLLRPIMKRKHVLITDL